MNVIVIPEDETNDRFILKPLFDAMFRKLGKPNTRVEISHPDPTGWEGVKQWKQIRGILDDFPQAHLFVLCVDRDGHEERRQILDSLQIRANEKLRFPQRFFAAEHAWQEIEVWALAGVRWRLKHEWTWNTIRSERDSKEHYFEPVAKSRGLHGELGGGRKTLGAEAARNYAKIRLNCPEVRDLEDRIRVWLDSTPHK
jgi:hypothetical protein